MVFSVDAQQHLNSLMQLERENRSLRELSLNSSSTTNSGSGSPAGGAGGPSPGVGEGTGGQSDGDVMRREKERHSKELRLLRKTIEEMELRIETQKQTLGTRDESIKKLMEMLQAKSRRLLLCGGYFFAFLCLCSFFALSKLQRNGAGGDFMVYGYTCYNLQCYKHNHVRYRHVAAFGCRR